MKYTDLENKELPELRELLKDKKLLIFSLKTKLKLMQVKNTSELRDVKKDIARINMAISRKDNQMENKKEKESA